MSYRILFFTTLLTISLNTHAQLKIGLSTGFSDNSLNTSTIYRPFNKYESELGFVVSLPVQYHFNNWLAVEADLSYIQKNYTSERTGIFSGVYQTTRNSYIQLPVMAHFSFGGERLRGFTNLGGYAAYWANSKIEGAALNIFDLENLYYYNEKYQFDNRRDNRLEIGLSAGLGIEYDLNNNYTFFIKADYYHGISDLQKDYMINQIPRYNNTVVFQLGCLLNISKKFQK